MPEETAQVFPRIHNCSSPRAMPRIAMTRRHKMGLNREQSMMPTWSSWGHFLVRGRKAVNGELGLMMLC